MQTNIIDIRRQIVRWVVVGGLLLLLPATLLAGNMSFMGTLGSGQANDTCSDVYAASCYYTLPFSLVGPTTVTIQSWGFGGTDGGTNAAGNAISAGGFDELISLWSGTGAGATLIDGSADVLLNYGQYTGCSPAGTVVVGPGPICGDLTMQFSLAAGSYTLTLSDAAYQPNALTCCGSTIGDGFADLTGGGFQTCNVTGNFNPNTDCIAPTADWAFDLNIPTVGPGTVPEPQTLPLAIYGCAVVALARRFRNAKKN